MSRRRINWSALGTCLFILFVLGVLAFEQSPSESSREKAEPANEATSLEDTPAQQDKLSRDARARNRN